jgi:hypothetical protein
MQPVVGQVIHRDQLELFDLDGCRLNWRPDNTAKVTRPEPDLSGLVRCSAADGCQVADICMHGKPHAPDHTDQEASRCYDHKPRIAGGVNRDMEHIRSFAKRPQGQFSHSLGARGRRTTTMERDMAWWIKRYAGIPMKKQWRLDDE